MPKRSSKPESAPSQPVDNPTQGQRGEEVAQHDVVAEQRPAEKNPAAVQLGRLGGKKGGLARAQKLTKEQRSEIARKAAQARWAKKTD
jgi:hypothetical protein